jgi:mRNA interferase MazF
MPGAPIPSTVREIPSEVLLAEADGIPREGAVSLNHIRTVAKAKIGPLITTVSARKMTELRSALLFALGF